MVGLGLLSDLRYVLRGVHTVVHEAILPRSFFFFFFFFSFEGLYFLRKLYLKNLNVSYFCTCTTFSASHTYKSTCACTSTTSSNHVGFFVRRTHIRRTNVRACCIQMSLLSSLAFQIKWWLYKIYTINCFIYYFF